MLHQHQSGVPATPSEWKITIRSFKKGAEHEEAQALAQECARHEGLHHYVPVAWNFRGVWAINGFIHDKKVPPEVAALVSRLMAGGQGLRGGDPALPPAPTVKNCCVLCLLQGVEVAETLRHFVFDCPAYRSLRTEAGMASVWGAGLRDVCAHHRDKWTWRELKYIRSFMHGAWLRRAQMLDAPITQISRKMDTIAQEQWGCVVRRDAP